MAKAALGKANTPLPIEIRKLSLEGRYELVRVMWIKKKKNPTLEFMLSCS